jgi:eukaryotic-like serine/threonine-protein kinase
LFFEEYQSKGADIKYIVKYVWAPEVKGTVVSMSKFNEFVPMTYTVEIRVSNNTSAPPNPTDFFEDEPGGIVDKGETDQPLEEAEDRDVDQK